MNPRLALVREGWTVTESASPANRNTAMCLDSRISKPGQAVLTCSRAVFFNEADNAGFDLIQQEQDSMLGDLYLSAVGSPVSEAA